MSPLARGNDAMLTDAGRERWEPAGWLLAAALLAVIVFGYLMPATGYFNAVPGDLGDNRYNALVLEHLHRVAAGYGPGLWNPDFFYPFQGALAFSDNHLGSGVTYVLARLIGLSREQAFNAWFVIGSLLNFAAALYALRRLGISTAAAALGACLFTFAVPVPAQDSHAQLVHRFAIPVAVLALWETFERRRLIELWRVAFFTAWQFYCSIYLGLFLVYLLAALTLAIALVRRPFAWREWAANFATERPAVKLAAASALLIAFGALAYLAATYLQVSRAYDFWRSIGAISDFLPRPGSYLIADGSPLLAPIGRGIDVPYRWEHQMFVGFGAAALVLAGAFLGRHVVPGLATTMLIALAMLIGGTLWIGDFSLYFLVLSLPGVDGIRALGRIVLVMLLPMAVLAALGAEAALRRHGRTRAARLALLMGMSALLVAEPLSVRTASTPIAQWRSRLDAIGARLPAGMAGDAILLVRTGSSDVIEQTHTELDAMLLGQDLRRPVLNGYSAFAPPGYRLQPCASARERLAGYARFARDATTAEHARRLVVIDLDSCPPPR